MAKQFKIIERENHHYDLYFYGIGYNAILRSTYDVVRTARPDKVIKSFDDLLEAGYYVNELEKMFG